MFNFTNLEMQEKIDQLNDEWSAAMQNREYERANEITVKIGRLQDESRDYVFKQLRSAVNTIDGRR